MRKELGGLLLAATIGVFASVMPAVAQENSPASTQAAGNNSIQALDVADEGGALYVRLTMQAPLAAIPASFSVANPPRLAFDFQATANGLGRGVQSIERGDLRSVNVVEVQGRTRVVLNLARMVAYETHVEGNTLVIALTPGISTGAVAAAPSFNEARADSVGQNINDINFRRGTGGEGRVVVQLSSADTGIDIRRQGEKLVVNFLKTVLPTHLRRRSDVTDFATPVSNMIAEQQGENVRLTITPNGPWEHNAYQSDNQFVLEVKRAVEDPRKLVQGASRAKYQGDKLSLNFQNIDVRSVLQVIADFTDFNIVTSDSVQGSLTLRLKDVPWDQALDIILQAKGLDLRKNGNVIWIAPGDELSAREKMQADAKTQLEDVEPLQTESFQINYHRAVDIVKFLQSKDQAVLSKRGSAVADERSNKIFATDVGARLTDLRSLITEIDIAPRQVLIEARIVEANKTFARDLGVKLGYGDLTAKNLGDGAQLGFGHSNFADYTYNADGSYFMKELPPNSRGTSYSLDKTGWFPAEVGNQTTPVYSGSGIGNPYGALSMTLFNRSLTRFLNLELQAQESDGKTRIISSPRVMTANNVEATIEQGREIPYLEASSSGSTSVSFKKAVLSLTVKPQITPDGRLQLAIRITKDNALMDEKVNGVPPIETKHVESDVLIDNGGTVVIGGIYTEEEGRGVTKVPLLGDIPVIGHLFRTTSRKADERELLVFITPRIVEEALTLR
ncbi:MAG: type IV pilus secretin PilQ [Azoarcus sp.]|jgi:type IV pilus assembly protein PilQ|nr:type IV pilus secretin PilQ [Azoarcus sp.]